MTQYYCLNLRDHEWIVARDSNGRLYKYCWRCPIVVHEWETLPTRARTFLGSRDQQRGGPPNR